MDPAEESQIRSAVELQGAMLGRHEEELVNACNSIEFLAVRVAELLDQIERT